MINVPRKLIFLLPVLALWCAVTLTATAQSSLPGAPAQLHLADERYALDFPQVVADAYGRTHVVAAISELTDNASTANGSLIYTMWNGTTWSNPVDVAIAQDGGFAAIHDLVLSDDGQLHVIWSEAGSQLNYSVSNSLTPTTAQNWSTVPIAGQAGSGAIHVGDDGELQVAFVQNNRDVVLTVSADGGRIWSTPTSIWQAPTPRQAARDVRIIVDDDGFTHVTWTETDVSLDWNPSGVWYARSADGGQSWSDFFSVANEGSYINVAKDAEGTLHLVWNQNVGSDIGRYHVTSADNGVTWTEPQPIFAELSGRTGFPRMLVDDVGTLHLVLSGNGLGRAGGIYHSLWQGSNWSAPTLISNDSPQENNEGPAAAIANGNELHIVWRNNNVLQDVVHAQMTIGAPAVAPLPLPETAPFEESATSAEMPAPTAVVPTVQPTIPLSPDLRTAEPPQSNDALPLMAGLLVSAVVVALILSWQWRRLRVR